MSIIERKIKVIKHSPVGPIQIDIHVRAPSMPDLTLLEYTLVGVKQEITGEIRLLKGMRDRSATTNNK